jgi:hypothetical protein
MGRALDGATPHKLIFVKHMNKEQSARQQGGTSLRIYDRFF